MMKQKVKHMMKRSMKHVTSKMKIDPGPTMSTVTHGS
jgi:hypothetical protein